MLKDKYFDDLYAEYMRHPYKTTQQEGEADVTRHFLRFRGDLTTVAAAICV